jgi:choline dehydrogenase
MEVVRGVFRAPALRPLLGDEVITPLCFESLDDDAVLLAALTELSHTLYHPARTARMGTDPGSVVDPKLRVRGVDRLRAADASVMPEIIRGPAHASVVVIGAKAAALIEGGTRVTVCGVRPWCCRLPGRPTPTSRRLILD